MQKLNIISYCSIRDKTASLNGKKVIREENALTVQDFLKKVYKSLGMNYPKFYKMDLYSKTALVASEMLINDMSGSGITSGAGTGIVLSNATASLATDQKHQDTISKEKGWFPSPAVFVYTLPNIMAGEISIRYGITGEQIFFVTRHFDADLMEFYIKTLFEEHLIEQCLGGWVDVDAGDEDIRAFLFIVNRGNNITFTAQNLKILFNN